MTKRINIMTSCDDNLARYILPQIASIRKNLSEYSVEFYLLHSRISPESIQALSDYCGSVPNLSFHEIIVTDSAPYARLAKMGGSDWAYEAYYGLCCHDYLPNDVDRVLYIDAGDVVIDGDIADYYFGDFSGRALFVTAARFKGVALPSGESDVCAYEKDDMNDIEHLKGIKRGLFNSGAYVINVERFRQKKLKLADYLDLAELMRGIFPKEPMAYFGDQGLLSIAFAGDIAYYAFPDIRNIFYMPYNFCLWYFDRYANLPYEPRIIHFCGDHFLKPWRARFSADELRKYSFNTIINGSHAPFNMKHQQIEYCEKWWSYCAQTPIYEEANLEAASAARALEKYYLPLCKSYNELVDAKNK